MASVEVNQMLAAAVGACEDKKAEDIRVLALDPSESGLTDYFLICTGTNDRQTVAITDEIELRLKREFNTYPNSVEGRRQGEWVLMDYVDFIVHVFLPEKRAFYGLERLRKSATTLSIQDLNNEIKAVISANRTARKSADKAVAKETTAERSATKSPAKKKPSPRGAPSKPAKKAAKAASKSAASAKERVAQRPRKTATKKGAKG